jgi:hypothetical protein
MKAFRLLTWFTQLALSAVSPLLLCIWGAVWLRSRFQLGGWIVLLGVLLGIGGAFSGFRNSLELMRRESERDEKNDQPPPVSFNDHM